MKDDKFSYKFFFERVFDPIALYSIIGDARPVDAGRIVFFDVNPAYERVMKMSRDNIIGRSFREVWPMAEERWADIIVNCANNGRMACCEGESRDSESYLKAMAFPLSSDMVAAIFLDRTDWKQANDALLMCQSGLSEIERGAGELNQAIRRAAASSLRLHNESCTRQSENDAAGRPLSVREMEIMKLLAAGLSSKQIAMQLSISKNTVDTHRRRILDKIGCNNLAELTRYAIRSGY